MSSKDNVHYISKSKALSQLQRIRAEHDLMTKRQNSLLMLLGRIVQKYGGDKAEIEFTREDLEATNPQGVYVFVGAAKVRVSFKDPREAPKGGVAPLEDAPMVTAQPDDCEQCEPESEQPDGAA